MFKMLRNFFEMLSTMFEAGNKLANAANEAASFVEGEAAGFNERTSLARAQDLKKLRSQYKLEDRRMAAEDIQSERALARVEAEEEAATKPADTKPAKAA